ncbi:MULTISPECIES: bifunctional lytic transglycosylase/C40 family peptidase [Vagococcus]|uniref:Lipoprotein, NLP/P60 family n=1 Tax=Vagococcus fluvialis bH819 TaxID=1255619 RepID=A0A1X6WTX7_9ENTE|nr:MULTISPECIES: bifunctional lytic transglycosylase/C40 family peptidase [Vagococcus]SLM87076.1 lipoprotein, NLP/P60 family [Vagococcus fluvialis bH819]HCM90577.1 hypothetical protein [Vagococcus sp.]
MEQQPQKKKPNKIGKKINKGITKKYGKLFKIKFWAIVGIVGLIVMLVIGVTSSMQSFTSSKKSSGSTIVGGSKPLSEDVKKWQSVVERYCKEHGIPEMVPYVLAIMQVETGGRYADLMQSSESLGLPVNTLTEEASIEQGVKYLKSAWNLSKANGNDVDMLGVVQSYNFGTAYVSYLSRNSLTHNVDVAEQYSKTVVAPSLGNSSGATYSYVNEVSQKYLKPYLYTNGGNFLYSYLVQQYLGGNGSGVPTNPSEFFDQMRDEMEKFNGFPYVWGGKSPTTGFDCSGLTGYLYMKILGVDISTYTVTQYEASEAVSLSEAQSGDLIFFRGTYGSPDFISHVGIYVNETTMYDSNGSGTGYHNWQDSYWQNHSPEIRRVKN